MSRNSKRNGWTRGSVVSPILVMSALLLLALLPSQLGLRFETVLSGSMEPSFHPGDNLISISKPVSTAKVGEVVTLMNPVTGLPFTHRIVSIDSNMQQNSGQYSITTKGDANAKVDGTYTLSGTDEISKAVRVLPGGGYLLETLQANLLKLLGGLTFIVLILFVALRRSRKDMAGFPDSGRYADPGLSQVAVNYGRRATDQMAVVVPIAPMDPFDSRLTDLRTISGASV